MKTDQEHPAWAAAILLLLFTVFAGSPVLAESAPAKAPTMAPAARSLLPGVGADDRRVPVAAAEAPWRSLVRVQTNLGGRCTGALVAPTRVVTAAHCLFNTRTRRFLPVSSLHVLFGYARGDYSRHIVVLGIATDPAYDPAAPRPAISADWAVLTLAEPASADVAPLVLAAVPPVVGTTVMLGGYSQDRSQILMADRDCRILGIAAGLLAHDCDATRGTSGGPLLVHDGMNWLVAGVGVAAGGGAEHRNFAVPAARFAPALAVEAGAGQP